MFQEYLNYMNDKNSENNVDNLQANESQNDTREIHNKTKESQNEQIKDLGAGDLIGIGIRQQENPVGMKIFRQLRKAAQHALSADNLGGKTVNFAAAAQLSVHIQ